jgi:glyoxylase-like metal-dependent hydrolase (beta-lactamase superfamily II)
MSEPRATATRVDEVAPGLWRWHVLDERIGAESDAYAVHGEAGTVLIDPLPLIDAALRTLEPVAAICLTAACHQRSAWRYRKAHGVKVYAPAGSREMDEEPDLRYRDGDALPGGLVAIHTPGPEQAHYAFLRKAAPAVLFCPDLVMLGESGSLAFVPAEYHEDPKATRDSVRRLLEYRFDILCLAHGAPIIDEPHGALRELLADTR